MSKINFSTPKSQNCSLGVGVVLRNKPFLYLWVSQIFTQVSVALLNFSLLLWVFKLTGSNSAVSLVVLTIFASSVLFSVLAGVVADRVPRKNIMIVSNLLRIVVISLFFFAPNNFWWIILLSFWLNSIYQFFIPAEAATIPRLLVKEELLIANSLFAFSLYASLIGGFVLAGPVVDLFGNRAVFFLSGIFTLMSTLFITRLPTRKLPWRDNMLLSDLHVWVQQTLDQIGEGLRFVAGNRYVIAALLITVGLNGLIGLASSLAPGFVVNVLQIPATSVSYVIMAPLGTGLIAGALLVGKFGNQFAKRDLITGGMIVGGLLLFLMGLLPLLSTLSTYKILTVTHLPRPAEQIVNLSGFVSALSFFLGLVAMMVVIPSQTVLQQHTPDEVRGRVFGVFGVVVYGASSIPTLVGARLADWFGVTLIIICVGLLITIAGLMTRRWATSDIVSA